MISAVLTGAHRLDEWLRARFGRPYHALLGIGLVAEIVKEVRERFDDSAPEAGLIRTVLALLLFAALLIHQLGELRENLERRGRRRPP
jgi:hypothetical protein